MVILVKDYEEAIKFYTEKLGFQKFLDIKEGNKRYVHLQISTREETGIWLLKAESEKELSQVGNQTSGQPCAVIYTKDVEKTYKKFSSKGVNFIKPPKAGDSAKFAHFLDLYGNEFVLTEILEK